MNCRGDLAGGRMKAGQHFLVDRGIAERIAGYAEISSTDRVLEIGPGRGSLTEFLAARAGRVYAIEADPELARYLEDRFPNVEVLQGDALRVDLPEYNKVVSNLPYHISTKITLRLLRNPFDLMVLMYQREFVERMLASPGSREYGRLSVNVSYYADVEVLETVPRSAFRPMPHVSSSVVRLRPRRNRELVDESIFSSISRDLFTKRRKKVKNALASIGVADDVMLDLDPLILDARPEDLGVDEFVRIARVVSEHKSGKLR